MYRCFTVSLDGTVTSIDVKTESEAVDQYKLVVNNPQYLAYGGLRLDQDNAPLYSFGCSVFGT